MIKDKTLEEDAAEIRIRAERRLGELIVAQKASGGLNTGAAGLGVNQHNKNETPSSQTSAPKLSDVGISHNLSSLSQLLAAVPEAERRLGELILLQKETHGLNAGGRPTETPTQQVGVIPTLSEAGISHNLSSRSQLLAAVPEARAPSWGVDLIAERNSWVKRRGKANRNPYATSRGYSHCCSRGRVRVRNRELIRAQKEAGLMNKGAATNALVRDEGVKNSTLEDAGISHDISSRSQKLAAIS